MSLKKQLIKLGSENKGLRSHIRPLLAELDKAGGKVDADFMYNRTTGKIEKLRNPIGVNDRERCPFCNKALRSGEKIILGMFDMTGSDGAHLRCFKREMES